MLTSLSPGRFRFQPSNSQTPSFPGKRVWALPALRVRVGVGVRGGQAGTRALTLPQMQFLQKALASSGLVNVL